MRYTLKEFENFCWVGEGTEILHNRKLRMHYRSFTYEGQEFEIGDFVMIRNDDSIDPEDTSNCYVSQIKELYDTGDSEEPHQAVVQWFSRASELPSKHLKQCGEVLECEVIEDNRPQWSSVVDAETIFGKCEVRIVYTNFDMDSLKRDPMGKPVFICRYKFLKNKLCPMLQDDSEPQTPRTTSRYSVYQQAKSDKEATVDDIVKTPSKMTYRAIPTGTPEFPKVLLKRLDDRILENKTHGVRVIIAKPDAKTIEDVAETLRNNLFIDSVKKKSKRPIIHSLSVSSRDPSEESTERCVKIDELCTPSSSQVGPSTPRKSMASNTPSKRDLLTRSSSKSRRNTPRKAALVCTATLVTTPKKRSSTPHQLESTRTPKSAKKSSPVKRVESSVKTRNTPLKRTPSVSTQGAATPSKKTRSAKRTLQFPEVEDAKASTRSGRKVKPVNFNSDEVKQPLFSTAEEMSKFIQSTYSEECQSEIEGTHKGGSEEDMSVSDASAGENESCTPSRRKILKKTPKSNRTRGTATPIKTPKSSKRTLQFPEVEEAKVSTRSGRKVKPVNYKVFYKNDEVRQPLFSTAEKKMSKFIRSTYSDDSGSEYDGAQKSSSEDDMSVSDASAEENESRTPSRRKLLQKTPKSNRKKQTELMIPNRKTPFKEAQNVLEESRLRLHISAIPKSLPCREEEFSDIYSFVKGCLNAHTGGCMYISGVPGTGKTATVHEVVRTLEEERDNGDLPLFNFVEVNAMWMTDPYQCYVQIYKSLTGKTIASQQAANLLEKRFTERGPKKDAVVLLVDELDRLWTRKQTVMYNIFDWPSKKHSKLIVVAIANTMDLPERLMMNRISSRLGLTRKTFQPYTFRQLQEILMNRIQELKVFDPDAVQFVARKVAAVSGDARRALDICRHATEVAERAAQPMTKRKSDKIIVGMEHVDEAIQQVFSSPVVAAIKCSSKLCKLFLEGMLSEFTRTGTEEAVLIKVSRHIISCCNFEGLHPPSSAEIFDVCTYLAAQHLILVDNFQNAIYMKLRLSVSPDDVSYALTSKA